MNPGVFSKTLLMEYARTTPVRRPRAATAWNPLLTRYTGKTIVVAASSQGNVKSEAPL
jgi:hypothetical protein